MIDPRQNTEVNDEAIDGFKTESSQKFYWRIADANENLKLPRQFFAEALQTWLSKTVHIGHPFGGFLFCL